MIYLIVEATEILMSVGCKYDEDGEYYEAWTLVDDALVLNSEEFSDDDYNYLAGLAETELEKVFTGQTWRATGWLNSDDGSAITNWKVL